MNTVKFATGNIPPNYANSPITPTVYSRNFLEGARNLAFKLTGVFEGGNPGSYQTKNSGIVSYGKHQATLASGSLHKVIDLYTQTSNSEQSKKLAAYLTKTETKDKTLRNDAEFKELLIGAAKDALMGQAQDKVFSENYWLPVVKIGKELGIQSEIGLAVLYDTNIQGGLKSVLERTYKEIGSQAVDEKEFLNVFLLQRNEYLKSVAANKRKNGDAVTAKMLENSARTRIPSLQAEVKKYL